MGVFSPRAIKSGKPDGLTVEQIRGNIDDLFAVLNQLHTVRTLSAPGGRPIDTFTSAAIAGTPTTTPAQALVPMGLGGTGSNLGTGGLIGDILIAGSPSTMKRLAGNTTTTKKFLSQTGNGTISADPAWAALDAGDIKSGLLAIARGGTNAGSYTSGRLIRYDGSSFVDSIVRDDGSKIGIGAAQDATYILRVASISLDGGGVSGRSFYTNGNDLVINNSVGSGLIQLTTGCQITGKLGVNTAPDATYTEKVSGSSWITVNTKIGGILGVGFDPVAGYAIKTSDNVWLQKGSGALSLILGNTDTAQTSMVSMGADSTYQYFSLINYNSGHATKANRKEISVLLGQLDILADAVVGLSVLATTANVKIPTFLGIGGNPDAAIPLYVAGSNYLGAMFGSVLPIYTQYYDPIIGFNLVSGKFGAGSSSNYGARICFAAASTGTMSFSLSTAGGNAGNAASLIDALKLDKTGNATVYKSLGIGRDPTSGYILDIYNSGSDTLAQLVGANAANGTSFYVKANTAYAAVGAWGSSVGGTFAGISYVNLTMFYSSSAGATALATINAAPLYLVTNSSIALTISTDQTATFAGNLKSSKILNFGYDSKTLSSSPVTWTSGTDFTTSMIRVTSCTNPTNTITLAGGSIGDILYVVSEAATAFQLTCYSGSNLGFGRGTCRCFIKSNDGWCEAV